MGRNPILNQEVIKYTVNLKSPFKQKSHQCFIKQAAETYPVNNSVFVYNQSQLEEEIVSPQHPGRPAAPYINDIVFPALCKKATGTN